MIGSQIPPQEEKPLIKETARQTEAVQPIVPLVLPDNKTVKSKEPPVRKSVKGKKKGIKRKSGKSGIKGEAKHPVPVIDADTQKMLDSIEQQLTPLLEEKQ